VRGPAAEPTHSALPHYAQLQVSSQVGQVGQQLCQQVSPHVSSHDSRHVHTPDAHWFGAESSCARTVPRSPGALETTKVSTRRSSILSFFIPVLLRAVGERGGRAPRRVQVTAKVELEMRPMG
jgi:hypothetical protein